jgi:biotin carboxylase
LKRILFVHGRAGTPLEYSLPRIAACARVHVLAISPLPTAGAETWRPHCAEIIEAWSRPPHGPELVDLIASHATTIGADAIMCFSEYLVVAAAEAAMRLGLRGPGPNVRYARDKRLMRERWRDAGVPIPRFRRVGSEVDVHDALDDLRPPLLLKPAWGSGSIGQAVVNAADEIPAAWHELAASLRTNDQFGLAEWYETESARHLLVEEIVVGSTDGWFARPGYGDYVSVEGIIADGCYHPVGITARLPTIPPFTELSSNAPCLLPEPLQHRIEAVARDAVNALELDDCGTHTEIKLCPDGELVIIESAARFGGSVITRVLESVFGLDVVTMLARQLLGEVVQYPDRMLVRGRGAAATLAWVPADASGVPWTSTPVWDPGRVSLDALVSPGSSIEIVRELTAPAGTRVPEYDPSGGARNCFGRFFVTADDAETLLGDLYSVLNGLESTLKGAADGR